MISLDISRYTLITCLLIMSFVGTISNFFIIGAIVLEKNLKHLGNTFIANLAVADMLVTALVFPLTAGNVIYGKSILPPVPCQLTAIVVSFSAVCSVQNITCVSADRYLAVCYPSFHKNYFGKKMISVLLFLTWFLPIFLMVPIYIWFNDALDYDPRNQTCVVSFLFVPIWYSLYFLCSCVVIPIVISAICYGTIMVRITQSRRKLGKPMKKSDVAIYRTLIVVWLLFVIFWLPSIVAVFLQQAGIMVPDELYSWFSLVSLANSTINGFVYGLSNKHFRKGYSRVLQLIFCCFVKRGKIAPLEKVTEITDMKGEINT